MLLMQSVNGAQFLKITSLLFLSTAIAALLAHCPTTVMHHYSHKDLALTLVALSLIFSVLYVPCDRSFISIQLSLMNLDGWVFVLSNRFIIFWYSILFKYYFKQTSAAMSWPLSNFINNVLTFFRWYVYFYWPFICIFCFYRCYWFTWSTLW